MIQSRADYLYYIESDRIALGKPVRNLKIRIKEFLFPDPIWKFQRIMRRLEYYSNVKKCGVYFICITLTRLKYRKISRQLGFTIPINIFAEGLAIAHYGTIVINSKAKVGKNCRIHPCTSIGASGGSSQAPQLGDNIYIAPGVKIYGDISIASNIAIAANAAVGKSFKEEGILIGGVPAQKIKGINISTIIRHIG
jgi:serine O-acetyltransferase